MRTSIINRITNETQVQVTMDLDGSGKHQIETGVGFLDHMLTQLAVHGLFDIQVKAAGDTFVDNHHTVEDVALALGQAFSEALGNRSGIVRMGSAFVPMDESLGFAAVDFSGRSYTVVKAAWHSCTVGTIPVSLIEHFLNSFSTTAGCNIHCHVLYGSDDHHQAEAIFKALGRALNTAVRMDPHRTGDIPSSKGLITGGQNDRRRCSN